MSHAAPPITPERLRRALQHPLPGLPIQMRMAPVPRPGTVQASAPKPGWRPAGVLLLLYPRDDDLGIVLTRRTASVEHHSGQISLPGGGIHPGESAREAALRETHEELGVTPAALELIGELSPLYIPPSGYCVYPFVAYAGQRPHFVANPREVDEVIEAPLSHLLDPAARCVEIWPWEDASREVPFYAIGSHKVWGATAMILCEFLTLIGAGS